MMSALRGTVVSETQLAPPVAWASWVNRSAAAAEISRLATISVAALEIVAATDGVVDAPLAEFSPSSVVDTPENSSTPSIASALLEKVTVIVLPDESAEATLQR